MTPSSPGAKGFCGFSGIVQPQDAETSLITRFLLPVFLKRKDTSIDCSFTRLPKLVLIESIH